MLEFAKAAEKKSISSLLKWKILIADDEKEVHQTTKAVLKRFVFEDKELEIFHAYSGKETIEILKEHRDIALVLLDVVMESDDAGLQAVKSIRNELKNKNIRIVLRTGQPGQVPQKEVIRDYDINDYKEKTELTSIKLYSTVMSALRAYRDMMVIEQNRLGLMKIVEASKSMFAQKSLTLFVEGILTQLVSILHLSSDAGTVKAKDAFLATLDNGKFSILATAGKFGIDSEVLTEDATYFMYEAFESKKSFFKEDVYVGFFQSEDEKNIFLYLEGCRKLSDIDKSMIEIFSHNISIAFNNICLHDELLNTQSEIVKRLGEVIESRSKETANHVGRVANTAYILAKAYGLSEEGAVRIKFASPMHDIGKVGIPDEILLKPGKLTKEEFEEMKKHSMIGWEILKDSNREILKTAALIARDHHEKWDGSGYPSGLKGEEISICGRIIAVADVLDALSHKRVYKDAWEMDRIIKLFKEERGRHFEPKLVDLLFENFKEITGYELQKDVEVGGNEFVKNMKLSVGDVCDTQLEKLLFEDAKTAMIVGYISPHVDFDEVSLKIKEYFGKNVKVILSTSAGELCNINTTETKSIYLEAKDSWDSIVLQSFSDKIIKDVNIYTVNLKNEDILSNNIVKTTTQRVEEIEEEIKKAGIREDIDYKSSFAFTLIDGVSNSENFFMEAIYKSELLPCNIIGGSAGGKLDFEKTYIFDDGKTVQNSAVIALVEVQNGIKFGILKSQNFTKTKHSFLVVDADPAQRYIKTIKRKDRDEPENIIDYFCEIFRCDSGKLEKKFNNFTFGIDMNDELYIRSVSSVDLKERRVNFYIDVDFGDELFLCRMSDFKKQTYEDYERFLSTKNSKPIAGLLNDCILRRVNNDKNIDKLRVFDDVPLIGFSTFGELLGININQTLTALFFFEAGEDEVFRDKYVDNFIVQYSNYKSFFKERELKQLKSKELKRSFSALSSLNKELEEKIIEIEKSKKQLVESEKMASLGAMVAGVAHEINTPVGMALTGITYLEDETKELNRLYKEAKITEQDFTDFLENTETLNKSIQNNLLKAAGLVKSFKQVSVDRSSDENRVFYLYEYVQEVLLSIHSKIKKTKLNIVVDIDKNIKLNSNPGAFSQIITNFIFNSIIHAFEKDEKGEIRISSFCDEKNLRFIYEDNGKGLDEEQKSKIFDPFYTTNRANGGSGLGMNIVYNLITSKLNGEIALESVKGKGIKFDIFFKDIVVVN